MSGYNGPGNPYGAPQQPGGWGQQPGPYGQQPHGQPPYGGQYPGGPGQGPQRPARVGAGVAIAVVAGLVCMGLHALFIKESDKDWPYLAVVMGAVIGFAAGRVGGKKQPVLAIVAALLAAGATYGGWYFGVALDAADAYDVSVTEVMDKLDIVELLNEALEAKHWIFLILGAIVAAGGAWSGGQKD